MNKSRKYGVNAAVIMGFIWMVADAVKQHDEIASNSIQKFDWARLMKAA